MLEIIPHLPFGRLTPIIAVIFVWLMYLLTRKTKWEKPTLICSVVGQGIFIIIFTIFSLLSPVTSEGDRLSFVPFSFIVMLMPFLYCLPVFSMGLYVFQKRVLVEIPELFKILNGLILIFAGFFLLAIFAFLWLFFYFWHLGFPMNN